MSGLIHQSRPRSPTVAESQLLSRDHDLSQTVGQLDDLAVDHGYEDADLGQSLDFLSGSQWAQSLDDNDEIQDDHASAIGSGKHGHAEASQAREQEDDHLDMSQRAIMARTFRQRASWGWQFLVVAAMNMNDRDAAVFQSTQNMRPYVKRQFELIFLSTPLNLLYSIIDGNLELDLLSDRQLRVYINTLQTQANSKHAHTNKVKTTETKTGKRAKKSEPEDERSYLPCIYIQQLCDMGGLSPTPRDFYEIIIPKARSYASTLSDDEVDEIDSWILRGKLRPGHDAPRSLGTAEEGYRRYLTKAVDANINSDADFVPIGDRMNVLDNFLDALKMRIENISRLAWDEPMHPPLVEFGWTIEPIHRFAAHESHNGSNFLMNLFEALCNTFLKAKNKEYRIHRHIIYRCWSAEQPAAAEVFFHRIGSGYIDNGGGFSYSDAGSNTTTASNVTLQEWIGLRNATYKDGTFGKRLRGCKLEQAHYIARAKAEASRKQLEQLMSPTDPGTIEAEEITEKLREAEAAKAAYEEADRNYDEYLKQFSAAAPIMKTVVDTLADIRSKTDLVNKQITDTDAMIISAEEQLARMISAREKVAESPGRARED